MARVLFALAPLAVFAAALYGLPALLVMAVSVTSAELAEALFRKATKQPLRSGDLSAAVTGLLLALTLPPALPLWMAALGAAFAVVVAKEFFGGLGANVFNPALAGRAFLLMSFPAAMTTWHRPVGWGATLTDAVTTATPLGALKTGAAETAAVTTSGLFWGNHAGSIGETSIFLILVGFVFLLVTRTIDWRAPATMTASCFLFSLLSGGDPVFAVLSGGVAFGAVFMATDYVSAPVTGAGRLLFGAGAGLITALIRRWGNYPEGVTYGILIMNAASPFLDRLLPRKYGYVPPKKGGAK
jgi:electron transport complex protein RnfD